MQYEPAYYIGKYRKHIAAVFVLIAIGVTGVVAYIQWRDAREHAGKVAVPVEVVPRDAQVKLSDGQELPGRGTVWLKPGEYKVTVSSDGFAPYTSNLRVSSDSMPYIYTGLAATSDKAKKWQEKHASEYHNLELLTIQKSRDYNVRFKSSNPIVNILPIKDPYYSIDYRNYDDKSVELIIYGASPRYRQAAIDLLRTKGYEPTEYRITYDGFVNPLSEASHE